MKTNFIRFIIKLKYISIDLKKIEVIVNWQNLENIIGLKLFLGFYNYYKKFIVKQLNKIEFFIRIIKKDKLQKWGPEQKELFKNIKEKFIKKPILKIY